MKRIFVLIVAIVLCAVIASCTNQDRNISPETTSWLSDETNTVQTTEYGEEPSVKEETKNINQQTMPGAKIVENETVSAELIESTTENGTVDEIEYDNTIQPTDVTDEGILKPDAEFGSPGIDD